MQTYEVLGIAGMLFVIIATILQITGKDETLPSRAVLGAILLGLGMIFATLARERALMLFPHDEFPISLAKCYAVIMMAMWVGILPHLTHRIFRVLAIFGLMGCAFMAMLIFFFAK